MPFTTKDLEQASIDENGPFFDWLARVRLSQGDASIRCLALEVLRSAESLRHDALPPLLVDCLDEAIRDPQRAHLLLKPWQACDTWRQREVAKLLLTWGPALRTGDSLVRQVAVVCYFHLWDQDPGPVLEVVRQRLRISAD